MACLECLGESSSQSIWDWWPSGDGCGLYQANIHVQLLQVSWYCCGKGPETLTFQYSGKSSVLKTPLKSPKRLQLAALNSVTWVLFLAMGYIKSHTSMSRFALADIHYDQFGEWRRTMALRRIQLWLHIRAGNDQLFQFLPFLFCRIPKGSIHFGPSKIQIDQAWAVLQDLHDVSSDWRVSEAIDLSILSTFPNFLSQKSFASQGIGSCCEIHQGLSKTHGFCHRTASNVSNL